ncbi:DegV family protein [Texcoconibacillus texcoconensis]|uniref:DegV family protein with EDD domain n=1 Tax=Texcoconibacillus texcoconensis TaxID=1095777 RepID=A0A840QQC0_9BACI|nr:DegV family protein with EDD domain [Texcoconibacillus texcoconensis]
MSKSVKIVTDSTVDLPREELEALGVTVVPLTVTIDGQSYIDGVDIKPNEFIAKLKTAEKIPQSSQPSPGVFKDVYDRLGEDGSSVISIHMTSGMSGTYTSAQTAAEMTDTDVSVIDSSFISVALSFQVKEAVNLAKQGATKDDILAKIEEVKEHTSLYIMVDTLEYLVKGGRIGRGKGLVGSLLKIKPIASLADGVYTPVSKVRTYVQMINQFRKTLLEETEGKKIAGIGIAHAEANELAEKLKSSIKGATGYNDISIIETTPIISTHAGPGAIALMYYTET